MPNKSANEKSQPLIKITKSVSHHISLAMFSIYDSAINWASLKKTLGNIHTERGMCERQPITDSITF